VRRVRVGAAEGWCGGCRGCGGAGRCGGGVVRRVRVGAAAGWCGGCGGCGGGVVRRVRWLRWVRRRGGGGARPDAQPADGQRIAAKAVIEGIPSLGRHLGRPTTADRDKYMAFMRFALDRRETQGHLTNPIHLQALRCPGSGVRNRRFGRERGTGLPGCGRTRGTSSDAHIRVWLESPHVRRKTTFPLRAMGPEAPWRRPLRVCARP
jgi:hypothetical protein